MSFTNNSASRTIQSRSAKERTLNTGFIVFSQIFAWSVAGTLIWLACLVGWQAIPAISKFGLGFVFTSSWNPPQESFGVWPEVYGTLASSFIALALSVPIGLGVAIFLSEDYLPTPVQRVLVFLVELLAAIPSVVFGLWGIFVLIPFLKELTPLKSPALLPAALVLGVMILPTITAISRDAMINVPQDLRQAAYGLGATRWETIIQILIPAASSGIIGGVMLALGRALGETMAVTMLIGNANQVSLSLFAPANSIAARLANQFAEASGLQVSALMYAALILFGLTLAINIIAQLLVTRLQKI